MTIEKKIILIVLGFFTLVNSSCIAAILKHLKK